LIRKPGGAGARQFFQHRGVAYWQSKKGDDGGFYTALLTAD